jgi:hypothetical protein
MLVYAIFFCGALSCQQVPIVHTLPDGTATPLFASKSTCETTMRETAGTDPGWRCLSRFMRMWHE